MRASPNGHSRVWVELPEHCDCQIVIWGIETSREASLKYPFTISEPFVPVETHKHIDAEWRRPLEVWKSFRGSRAPYGAAAQRAYIPSHVSIGCVLLTATGLQGVREFAQLCKAAKELLGDGVIQVVCLLDHGLLPERGHEIGTMFAGKEYELTRVAQIYGFTTLIGHTDDGATGGASMFLVKNGEIKVKASTHSTRIRFDWRGLEYDIAELTVDKTLDFMNLDLRLMTSMDEFMRSETVTIKEVWLDPTKVNESGRGKWDAIIARWNTEGSGNLRSAVATARREAHEQGGTTSSDEALRSAAATTRRISLELLGFA